MHKDVINAIDMVDSAVFTGDSFIDKDNRAELRSKMARWEKELMKFDDFDNGDN